MVRRVERLAIFAGSIVVACAIAMPVAYADDTTSSAHHRKPTTARSGLSQSATPPGSSHPSIWGRIEVNAGETPPATSPVAQPSVPQPVARKIPGRPLKPMPGVTIVPAIKPTKAPAAAWPVTLGEAKAAKQAATKPAEIWSLEEIHAERTRCTKLLKASDAVVVYEDPIRQGECGAAAPVQLISVGKNPQVALSPPVTVTCDMAVEVDKWVKRKLQPLARQHLGQPLIKIDTMSSYSCRNAYGRANGRLSEHARANAIDIRGFTTQVGTQALVLADWGLTDREIQARIATAEAAQAKINAQNTAQQTAANSSPKSPPPAQIFTAASSIGRIQKMPIAVPGSTRDAHTSLGLTSGDVQKLGGPKPSHTVQNPEITLNPTTEPAARFLRAAHSSACQMFGTTLGPEANKAHGNHFHIDLAQRTRNIKICR